MADDLTQQLNGGTFEERIMARFDAMDARFNSIDTRLNAIENRLDAIETRLDAIETRLDAIENRLDAVETRLDAVETRLDAVENRLDAVENRLDAVENRLSALEAEAEVRKRETRPLWEKALAEIAGIAADVKEMKADITILVQDSHKVRAKQLDLETRVRDIEIYLRSNPAEQPSR